MSITLYLLNKKGFEVLKVLVDTEKYKNLIDAVVGGRDFGIQNDYYDKIRNLCNDYKIRHLDRCENLKIQSEFSIAIGWRWLIKNQKSLIVLHDSYLPKYRGFSPIVNMLINGENYLGATAIWATEKMDSGNIIIQKKIAITYPLKIEKAIELTSAIYVEITLKLFNSILDKEELNSVPQKNDQATYSIWRNEKDYFINWADDAAEILRFIDAVGYPYDGAKTKTDDGEIIRIVEAEKVDHIISEVNAPGKLLMYDGKNPIILCGKGAVKLLKIQDLNKNPYSFKKFRIRLV